MSQPVSIRRLTGPSKGNTDVSEASELSFGSGMNATVRFDPTWDRGVSPSHARAFRDATGVWWVEDAPGSGGTWVNGQRLVTKRRAEGSTVLELGRGGPKVEVVFPERSAPRGSGNRVAKHALTALAVMAVLGFSGWWYLRPQTGSGETPITAIEAPVSAEGQDERLQKAAAANASAVGVVIVVGEQGPDPCATAWAVRENVFATNAHVVRSVGKAFEENKEVYITINRQPQTKLRVIKAIPHSRFGDRSRSVQGKDPVVSPWDAGLLQVEGTAPSVMRLAGQEKLRKLNSGTRVAYLGFPMEDMQGEGVNAYEPVATMQSGIVTSVSDFWLGAADPAHCFLVSHNLAATGGSSGSPIFDADGEVVALLSAGNIIQALQPMGEGKFSPTRAPSAVMVNFGQRADMLSELLDGLK